MKWEVGKRYFDRMERCYECFDVVKGEAMLFEAAVAGRPVAITSRHSSGAYLTDRTHDRDIVTDEGSEGAK